MSCGNRDLHLRCKDGLVTWSCLFLAPVVSDDLWGAIAELNSCQRCSRSGATVLLLPDFELETAMYERAKCFFLKKTV